MQRRAQPSPRTRILAVADRLFYTHGVNAAGTEKIMAGAKVAKATFYRHFKSKDALVLAYLERRDRFLWDTLAHPAPARNLREALQRFEQLANRPDVTSCPFLRIAAEFPDLAHPFHRAAVEHQKRILDYLTALLKPFPLDQRAAAAALLGVIDGALCLRMLHGTARKISLLASAEAVLAGRQAA